MGCERSFVEAHSSVQHARCVRAENFQRRVMRGDDGDAADPAKVLSDGDGQSGAFFGVGRGAQLIEQHERVGGRGPGDEIDVRDVGGKGGKILFDRLVVADVGEDGVEDREFRPVAGTGIPDWAINASRPTVFSVTVLPPVLGPVMISCGRSPSSSTVNGDNGVPLGFRLRSSSG